MVSETVNPKGSLIAYPVAGTRLNLAAWVASSALATCVLALAYAVDPRTPGNYPPCLLVFFTGCYCPGCGTLRALHTLMHGNLRAALGHNLLSVTLLPFLGAAYAYGLAHAVSRRPIPRLRLSRHVAWAALAVVLAFWALRNLPVSPFSTLAP